VALDDEDNWAKLRIRERVSGIGAEAEWAKRCGFQSAVNTFFLENGNHRIKLRLKDLRGAVLLEREIHIRVLHPQSGLGIDLA